MSANQTKISALSPGLAKEYSSSSTYASGDYVLWQNAYWKCISAISVPEAWTPSHWEKDEDPLAKMATKTDATLTARGDPSTPGFSAWELDYSDASVPGPIGRIAWSGSIWTAALQRVCGAPRDGLALLTTVTWAPGQWGSGTTSELVGTWTGDHWEPSITEYGGYPLVIFGSRNEATPAQEMTGGVDGTGAFDPNALELRINVANTWPDSGGSGTVVATRTALQGYQLGNQSGKPLASEAEAEVLRTGKKDKQTAVSDPSVPSSGTATATSFIDTISQDANGVITPTKKNLPNATTFAKGIVQLDTALTASGKAADAKTVGDALAQKASTADCMLAHPLSAWTVSTGGDPNYAPDPADVRVVRWQNQWCFMWYGLADPVLTGTTDEDALYIQYVSESPTYGVSATRTELSSGYRLGPADGPNADKLLASEAEAEALRTAVEAVSSKLDSQAVAPAYSASSTYAIGTPVTYNGRLYTAIQTISTPEAWTPEHWEEQTLAGLSSVNVLVDDSLVPIAGPGTSNTGANSADAITYLANNFLNWTCDGAVAVYRNHPSTSYTYDTDLFTNRFAFIAVKFSTSSTNAGSFTRTVVFPSAGLYRIDAYVNAMASGGNTYPVVVGMSCNGGTVTWESAGIGNLSDTKVVSAIVSAQAGSGTVKLDSNRASALAGFTLSRLKVTYIGPLPAAQP